MSDEAQFQCQPNSTPQPEALSLRPTDISRDISRGSMLKVGVWDDVGSQLWAHVW